jgi:hypothetical protein
MNDEADEWWFQSASLVGWMTKRTGAHSMPACLNHTLRQSCELSQSSPSVKRPGSQPEHFPLLGQLKKGMCW